MGETLTDPRVRDDESFGASPAPCVFRTTPVVGGRALMLAYAVTGWIPVICVREVLLTNQPIDEIIQLLSVAAMSVFVLGWLTYSWLEFRHFGQSICRLPALPAVDGKSFAAEIECNLPLQTRAPVVVRLKSQAPLGKSPRRHWQIEQEIDLRDIRALDGKRVVVSVRLNIPPRPVQPATRGTAAGLSPVWALELSRRSPGMDFHAQFVIPVADSPEKAAGEPPAS